MVRSVRAGGRLGDHAGLRASALAVLVLAVSLALAWGGLPARAVADPAAPARDDAADPSASDNDEERPDAVSAMVTARVSGHRVEDLSQRSETVRVYANPDGTWTSDGVSEPERVEDAQGQWHDIDTTLVATGAGVAPRYAASDVRFSAGGDQVFAALTDDRGKRLEFRWPTVLPKPVLEGDTATYAGALPGVGDLVVTATRTGFTHNIVIPRHPDATDGPVDVTIPVSTQGAQLVTNPGGEVAVETRAGKTLVAAARPVMWDSSHNDGGDPQVAPVDATIGETKAGTPTLTLAPDEAFLEDPETVYPVVVDPSFTINPSGDTWVQTPDYPSSQAASDELKVGTYDGGGHKARSFLKFDNGDAKWTGVHVLHADLKLRNYYSGSCTGSAIRASRIIDDWTVSGITWANQPAVGTEKYADSSAAKGFNSSCPGGDVTWDLTAMVQGWHDGFPNHGVRLKAVDESSVFTWRRYRSANYDTAAVRPRLVVDYNSYPDKPGAPVVSPGNTGYATSATPTLKATLTDPDKGTVRGIFEIYQGSTKKWSGTSAYVSSGSTATITVPASAGLTTGTSYTVKVKGNDGTDDSKSYSASTAFTVDTTTPTLADSDVTATAFSNGQWRTEVPGSNTFTFNGPADTASFSYTLDGVTQPTKAANSSGDASIGWLPKSGAHKLTVKATDKAGNTGNTVTFSFGVGPAAFLAPNSSARSTGAFPIQVSGPPNATSAMLSWRYAGTSTWKPADGITKNGAAWHGSVSNASDAGSSLSGALLWDATAQVEDANATPEKTIAAPALLELRTCFTYAGTPPQVCSAPRQVQLVPSAFGGNFPTTTLGPAQVALFTGEMSFTEPDAVDTAAGVGRSFSSFDPATAQPGAFGPGWSTALFAPGDAGARLLDNRAKDGTLVLVTAGDASQSFAALDPAADVLNPAGPVTFGPVGTDDGSRLLLDGATLTLTRPQASTTTWALQDGAWVLQDADTDDDTDDTPQTSFSTTAGELTWIAQTAPGTASACTATEQAPGCRGLKISYDGTAALRRVTKVELVTRDHTTELASYGYSSDQTGRLLRTACGPDPDGIGPLPKLCAAYTYATVSGRTLIETATAPGQAAWKFGYDSTGRLTTVSRTLDPATNTGAGDATWTVRYDLATTTAGLPDMSAASITRWGQSMVPTKAYAVFDPSDPNTTDLTLADLYYTTADGATTNTAVHGNADGLSQWLVDTTWYDEHDNIVQTLDGAGRARALTATTLEDQQVAATDASSFIVYNHADDPASGDTASGDTGAASDGRRVEDEYGPVHTVTLKDGTSGPYRSHTAYVYDDENITLGGGSKPPLEQGQQAFDLVVEERHSAVDPDRVQEYDASVVRYDYDPIVPGDGNGWNLGTPTRAKVQLADGSWSTTVTRYDAEGRQIETRQPGGATNPDGSGADAHATVMSYYATGTGVDPACRTDDPGHPERKPWIGLPCKTGPAGNAQLTPTMPVSYYAGYNDDLQPTRVEETSGNTTRTTTTSYDNLGRITTTTITDGSDTRTTNQSYDAATGLPVGQANAASSVTTQYDSWARPWKYTDATGMTSTATYTPDGQLASRDDGVGTYTYTYDTRAGEHRRLPGSIDVGLPAGTPDVFELTYDPTGGQSRVTYPNGMVATYGYDEAGVPTSLNYADGNGQNLLSFANTVDVDGLVVAAGSDASTQSYSYDALGRLTKVEDTRDGQCTTRNYAFSAASERTGFHSYNPDSDGNCQTTTATVSKTNTYDTANRIRNTGYIYDNLGRTLTVPATDTSAGAASDLALAYYANDMVKSMTQTVDDATGGSVAKEVIYGLDATGRIDTVTDKTGSTEDNRLRYRFSDDSDAPSSIQTSWDAGATWSTTRYVAIPALGMVATVAEGSFEYQIGNLHGDVVATGTSASGAAAVDAFGEADEYGNQIGSSAGRYGWLGSRQRSTDTLGGLMHLGARLYNPQAGSFMQGDPIIGGGATLYGYPFDPINMDDASGEFWKLMKTTTSQPLSAAYLRHMGHQFIDVGAAIGSGVTKRITSAIQWIKNHAEVSIFGFGIGVPLVGKLMKRLSVVAEVLGAYAFIANVLDRAGRRIIQAANQSGSGYAQFIFRKYGRGVLRKYDLGIQSYTMACGGKIWHLLSWPGAPGKAWV